jgi:hypothetical protein
MKSLKYIITVLFIAVLAACDESLPFPDATLGIIPTVAMDPARETFDLNNRATTSVGFTLDYNNYGGNLKPQSIIIKVATGAAINSTIAITSAVPVQTITSFPANVSVTLAEVCTALGLNINTITNARSFELFFSLVAEDGTVFEEGTNLHPGMVAVNSLGFYRYRVFSGCKTGIEEGYYKATLAGTNRLGITSEKEVRISKQNVTLEAGNAYLNFLRDIVSVTDLTAGFYPKSGLNPLLIDNQPVGIRDLCGTYSTFNNALATLPSPNPQVAFTITSGTWDASTKTLKITWTDATNNITETTTFVKVRDL